MFRFIPIIYIFNFIVCFYLVLTTKNQYPKTMILRKLAETLIVLLLIVFPFFIGISIAGHTPYTDGNSFWKYVFLWGGISIGIALILMLLLKYFYRSFEQPLLGAAILLLMASPIIGIVGLAAPPDLSINMLDHPEREHLRYLILSLGALLFAVFLLLAFKRNLVQPKGNLRLIIIVLSFLCIAEFAWEFSHHYLYPEGLQAWMNQGSKAEDFGKHYDNVSFINVGVIGRYIQFSLILWLSFQLYKWRHIRIWNPIIISFFCMMGLISATVVFITEFNLPKGYEFLLAFFIPGMPFLLLYWIGIALLTGYKIQRKDL